MDTDFESELNVATDFLREVADHDDIGRPEVFEMCKDAIERLGLTDLYCMFRDATIGDVAYDLGPDGKVRSIAHDVGDA